MYLLEQSIANLHQPQEELMNVPLIRLKADSMLNEESENIIVEQFVLIQKVAYDIFKLTEKLKV
ncbi:hypothetical protein D9M68_713750 [compost metagenome]